MSEQVPASLRMQPERELRMQLDYAIALRQTVAPDFFFVQIGACDGRMDDPLYGWVRAYGWRGLLVEPQDRYFEELVENYRGAEGLEFRRAAIDAVRRRRTLWTLADRPDVPHWAGLLASFERETILSHRQFLPQIDELIQGQEVECIPLNDLLAEADSDHIDLLQIDVEGFDHELVLAIDFERFRPSIIHFEHVHLSPEQHDACIQRLLENEYFIALEDRDTLAYRPEPGATAGLGGGIEGPMRIQAEAESSAAAAHQAHSDQVAELERRLEEATAFTERVAQEAGDFRQKSLDEQAEFLNSRIEEALHRAEIAEQRLAACEAELREPRRRSP